MLNYAPEVILVLTKSIREVLLTTFVCDDIRLESHTVVHVHTLDVTMNSVYLYKLCSLFLTSVYF